MLTRSFPPTDRRRAGAPQTDVGEETRNFLHPEQRHRCPAQSGSSRTLAVLTSLTAFMLGAEEESRVHTRQARDRSLGVRRLSKEKEGAVRETAMPVRHVEGDFVAAKAWVHLPEGVEVGEAFRSSVRLLIILNKSFYAIESVAGSATWSKLGSSSIG